MKNNNKIWIIVVIVIIICIGVGIYFIFKNKTPPTSNANYGWLLNTLSKLGQNGVGAVLLANGALSADGD